MTGRSQSNSQGPIPTTPLSSFQPDVTLLLAVAAPGAAVSSLAAPTDLTDCPFPLLFLLGAPSLHRGWHLPRLQLQLTPSQHLRLPQCGSASYDSAAPAFHFSTPTRQPCTLLYPHCTSHGSMYLSSAHLLRQHTTTSWGCVQQTSAQGQRPFSLLFLSCFQSSVSFRYRHREWM